jgi:hypothetical protein
MWKSWTLALAACVGLLGATSLAQASVLAPGQTVRPVSKDGTFGAPNVALMGPLHFAFDGTDGPVTGTYREFVLAGRTGNPFGGLSFEYQFTVDARSTRTVSGFSAGGFAGWLTNVTFAAGGMIAPYAASRTANGDSIEYLMASAMARPGGTSMWLIVDTNAPSYQHDTVSLQGDGGSTGSLAALGPAPAQAAPEPATLTLAFVGLSLGVGFGYRRLRRPKPALA